MRIKVSMVGPIQREAKYQWFELVYQSDGKSQKPKKIMSFNDEFKTLNGAQPGDTFDVKLEKDDNGYWQWNNVEKVEAGSPEPVAASGSTGRAGNWETPEERARRQVLIVRQSCIAQAVAWLRGKEPSEGTDFSTEDVQLVAEEFETWVNRE